MNNKRPRRGIETWLVALGILLFALGGRTANAFQDDSPGADADPPLGYQPDQEPRAEDPAPTQDPVRFQRLGAEYGARQYRPGRWGLVGVDIANFSKEPIEALAQFGMSKNATLFHARKIWVPPDSVRRTWSTLRVPQRTTTPKRQDLYCQVLTESDGVKTVKARDYEFEQHISAVRIVDDPLVTGIIVPVAGIEDGGAFDVDYEMAIAARNHASLDRRVAFIGDRYLPAVPEAYDAVDQLVLNNDRFAEEPVGCAAIRSWLHDGGQIWLQLDRVRLESAARLLGERFRCEAIERVELHDVDIVSLNPLEGAAYMGERSYETPIPFTRLAVEDVEVTHEVDGWPAAFSIPYGRGRVVVTAVGGDAWVTLGDSDRDLAFQSRYDSTPELNELELVRPRPTTPATQKTLTPYLESLIGYEVVDRSVVITTLCCFCLFLVVCGVVLTLRGGLERMTWIAPIGALAASAPLIWLGMQAQQSAPASVAMAQYVAIGDASRHAQVTGALAVYRPVPGEISVGSDSGGSFVLDWKGLENSMRRMVRTDLDRWRWKDIKVTAGIRKADFRQGVVLPEPVEARGTFDETGFRGQLRGMEALEDVIIAAPGRPALSVRRDGEQLVATSNDQLAKEQFVVGALLSDEQRRRQQVYASLFSGSTRDNPFPARRLLMGWRPPLAAGFQFPEDAKLVGAALVSAPLMIDRPEVGAKMRVPAPFVRFKSTTSPNGFGGGSPLYNARTGEWITSEAATEAWLLCLPPREILPAKISKATLRLKCTIPSRNLTISGEKGGQSVELLSKANAIGPIEIVLTDPELLQLGDQGGFRFGVTVSKPFDEETTSELRWNIDYLDVEIEATTE